MQCERTNDDLAVTKVTQFFSQEHVGVRAGTWQLRLTSPGITLSFSDMPFDVSGRDRPCAREQSFAQGRRRRSNRPGTSQAKGPLTDGTLESGGVVRRSPPKG